MENLSGWQPRYSLEMLKTSFNVSNEYQYPTTFQFLCCIFQFQPKMAEILVASLEIHLLMGWLVHK